MKIIVSDNPVLLRCVSFEKSARHECSIEVVLTEGEDRMWERLSASKLTLLAPTSVLALPRILSNSVKNSKQERRSLNGAPTRYAVFGCGFPR